MKDSHHPIHFHRKNISTKNETRRRLTEVFQSTEKYSEKRVKSSFNLQLKKRRPLWKDTLVFAATATGVWMMSHVGLNFSAYSQIAAYKVDTLQASIVNVFETTESAPVVLEKLNKVKTPFRNKKIKPRHALKQTFKKINVYPSDNRLVLPRIDKNVPIRTVPKNKNWNELENNIQKGLRSGVVLHPVSNDPGTFGNFFVTGHSSYYSWDKGNYKDVFALLSEVKEGDRAEVYWEGKKYIYKLSQQRIILPTETSVLNQPSDKSIITLMTCWPVGTNEKRLIWTGHLMKVE